MRYALCLMWLLALTACSEKHAETSAPVATAPAAPLASPSPNAGSVPADSVARQRLALNQLPAALRPTGQLLEAWRWTDANGENTLVASRTLTSHEYEDADMRTARLLVRQYVRKGDAYQQLWQLRDDITNCPLDLTLGLLPGSTSVSDLDGNGRTETTLLYALGCQGGVDAVSLKLIMHEGAAKYALRGTAILALSDPDEMARTQRKAAGPVCCAAGIPDTAYQRLEGLYLTEKDFVSAPPAFLPFAQGQWRRWRTRANKDTEAK